MIYIYNRYHWYLDNPPNPACLFDELRVLALTHSGSFIKNRTKLFLELPQSWILF